MILCVGVVLVFLYVVTLRAHSFQGLAGAGVYYRRSMAGQGIGIGGVAQTRATNLNESYTICNGRMCDLLRTNAN